MTKYYQKYALVLCLLLDSTHFVFAGTTTTTGAPVDGTTTTLGAPVDGTTTTLGAPVDKTTTTPGFTTTLGAPVDGTTTTPGAPVDGTTTTLGAPVDGTTTAPDARTDFASTTAAADVTTTTDVATSTVPATTAGLDGSCYTNNDCLPNAICNSNMTCECDSGYKPSALNDCVDVIDSNCTLVSDCNSYLLHTDCDATLSTCVCLHGAYDLATRSCPCPALSETCNLDEECTSCHNNTICTGIVTAKTCECDTGYTIINGVCSKGLGEYCTLDSQCLPDGICNSTNACECDQGYKPSNANDCEAVITSDCSQDADCNEYLLHTDCDYFLFYCVCLHGAYDSATRSCPCPEIGDRCSLNEECTTCLNNTECQGFGVSKSCECATGYDSYNGVCSLGLGANCTVDSECLPNAICDSTTFTCVCDQAYRESTKGDCEEVYQASCTTDSECYNYLYGSKCSNFLYNCGCKNGFWDYDATTKTCPCTGMYGDCDVDEECATCIPNTECISSRCDCATGFEYVNDTCTLVTTTPATTTTTIHSVLDEACVEDSDCGNTTNSFCENGICACRPGYYADAGRCPRVLGSYCTTIENCTYQIDNSNCTNNICKCVPGYVRDGVYCAKGVDSGCNSDSECVENGFCNSDRKCQCLFGYTTVNRRCVPVLGGPCQYTTDCSYVDSNSACLDRKCECIGEYEIVGLYCQHSGSNMVNMEFGMMLVLLLISLTLKWFF